MKEDKYLLSSVNNALKILDTLYHHRNMSLSEICRETGFDKASAFRMLHTLEVNQYVEKDADGRYCLGVKFLYYENAAASRFSIVTEAAPFMSNLSFTCGHSIHLGILQDSRVITVHKEDSSFGLNISFRVGTNAPACSTAMGRCLLAYLPEYVQEKLLSGFDYAKYQSSLFADEQGLREYLRQVKTRGFAADVDERYRGFGSIAVPVFDRAGACAASIGCIFVAAEFEEMMKNVLPLMNDCAGKLSAALGAPGNRL